MSTEPKNQVETQPQTQPQVQPEVQLTAYQQAPLEVASYISGFLADVKIFADGLPFTEKTYPVESMEGANIFHNMLKSYGVKSVWTVTENDVRNNKHVSSFAVHWTEPETKSNRTPVNDAVLRKLFIRGFLDAVILPNSFAKPVNGMVSDMLNIRINLAETNLIKLMDVYLGEIKVQPVITRSEKDQTITYSFTLQNLNDFLLHTYNGYDQLGASENTMLISKMITQVKGINTNTANVPVSKFSLAMPGAVAPKKNSFGDVGYDLTLIGVAKQMTLDCTLYETGIIVEPAHGWYAEVVPRSSISKTGYMLANGQGIIDPTYRGTIKVALVKLSPTGADLDLTNPEHQRPVQIIFRPYVHHAFIGVEVDEMLKTDRNDKGFGSTNNKN
uniref:dUTP diphosphatase n=1 Tax=Clandestinovirus TaxID=2831644 RepID=A0A8F8KKJ2_9VIRU|nr:LAGLIDADG homing endonuclease [Clandestinovirus]